MGRSSWNGRRAKLKTRLIGPRRRRRSRRGARAGRARRSSNVVGRRRRKESAGERHDRDRERGDLLELPPGQLVVDVDGGEAGALEPLRVVRERQAGLAVVMSRPLPRSLRGPLAEEDRLLSARDEERKGAARAVQQRVVAARPPGRASSRAPRREPGPRGRGSPPARRPPRMPVRSTRPSPAARPRRGRASRRSSAGIGSYVIARSAGCPGRSF